MARLIIRFVAFNLLILVTLLSVYSEDESSWQKEMLLVYNKGAVEMNLLRAESQNNDRLRDYVEALSKMYQEPRDDDSIELSQKEFRKLIEADGEDQIAIASKFYGALILQDFLPKSDLENAKTEFRELFDSHQNRFFGQMALLKWVVIVLNHDEERQMFSRIAMAEGYEDRLTNPDIRRSYHKVLGEVYRTSGLSNFKAFEHLKKAYEIGFTIPQTQSDLVFSLGKLAEELNEKSDALAYYREFIEKYEHDPRVPELVELVGQLASN
ncbi:hypothetical protein MLD52_11045 [Puniceicoccaceae bacterium K14]|nr:hypothetical protein [Puniceicoccaceae bacterium K14]